MINFDDLKDYQKIPFEDYKYSYVILKPNAAIHFKAYMDELIEQKFEIINCYAIFDYETVNMALHPDRASHKYILPLSRLYNDFYSNYAILILIGKKLISYEDFCLQVHRFKTSMRDKFHFDYVSFAFNVAKVNALNEEQSLKIIAKDGTEIEKMEMNEAGTYMVFSANEVHSPDANVNVTVEELLTLHKFGVLIDDNIIPKFLLESISKYQTFAYIKEML